MPDPVEARPSEPPAATRSTRTRWKDLRLWVGVLLVVASVVLGARVLAAADDSVAVWRATRDLPAGIAVQAGDFEQTRVRFVDDDPGHHLAVADGEPTGHLVRGVGAGELVPAGALVTEPPEQFRTVSLQVPVGQVPVAVQVGSRVDVWLLPAEQGADQTPAPAAEQLLTDVLVVEAPAVDTMTGGNDRQVVLGVPAATEQADLVALIGAAGNGRIMISGRSAP